MSDTSDVIEELGNGIATLLFEAVRLQALARHRGETGNEERIAAFIAGVSAAEGACLHTDQGSGAFLLSRVNERRAH